ncbi:GH15 family glucan-1,4-alpha-glucosidase [Haloactinopolyspora alba]|uniref:GH15 family glucan-1,4-alpha-glucosidase n=1 Tax=Haloactinopolyspora alba TaxID=648780 RepID=A0A2P8DZQ4_9ACTN|nr:glycoside hydrolase family 15 protein [Haloactinopolyspora alba]PSL02702.1 GH15 family glucan-1,4-alpha-glucosidase [Haloactinopolyspora alba]
MAVPPDIRPEVLREYALLADGERGALIGPRGDIVWMCAPGWDSDAVFSALIGGAGTYAVSPRDRWYVWGGYYEVGSLIWHSRWMTSSGAIECREALAFPGDPHTAVMLRRVHANDDEAAEVDVVLDPRAGFGRHAMRQLHRNDDTWTARVGPLHLRWSGAAAARERDGALACTLVVPAGQTHDLILELSDQPLADQPVDASASWEATEHRWKGTMPDLSTVIARRDARHAVAVLRGMTSRHGGMAAAATTSLPERSEAGRNYDYRYSWIRDQCYAGQAAAVAGVSDLLDNAVEFIAQRILDDGPSLRPAYTVDGGPVPDEHTLRRVIGYPGGGNRAGNRVGHQFQLDAFGEALLLFAAAARDDRLGTEHWRAVEAAVAAIEERMNDEGAGVWELHDDRWTHSRLICATGLRAAAAAGAARSQAAAWTSLADTIVADTAKDSLHPTGRWQRTPTDPGVDVALLLPVIREGLDPGDTRSIATLDAVRTELTQDGYVYRFRHDQRPLYEAEGAFLLCGFVTAMADHQQGREVQARAWFERNRAACGPAGLYSEEYDVNQRQLRGNLPQAFVHAMLLEAACRLAQPSTAP